MVIGNKKQHEITVTTKGHDTPFVFSAAAIRF